MNKQLLAEKSWILTLIRDMIQRNTVKTDVLINDTTDLHKGSNQWGTRHCDAFQHKGSN